MPLNVSRTRRNVLANSVGTLVSPILLQIQQGCSLRKRSMTLQAAECKVLQMTQPWQEGDPCGKFVDRVLEQCRLRRRLMSTGRGRAGRAMTRSVSGGASSYSGWWPDLSSVWLLSRTAPSCTSCSPTTAMMHPRQSSQKSGDGDASLPHDTCVHSLPFLQRQHKLASLSICRC